MKYFSIIILLFIISPSFGQIYEEYIKKNENFIAVGLNLGTIQNNFNIRNSNSSYDLNSNIVPSLGLWFKYKKWPALAIGIPLTSINADTLAKSIGIKVNLRGQIVRGLVMDGKIYYLKGFNFKSLDSQEKFINPLKEAFDLNIDLKLMYLFNSKKFSYKAAYLFGEEQLKSSGSFTIGFSVGFLGLSTKVPFFRTGNAANQELDFQAISTFSSSLQGGYMHTFIFGKHKRWYTNLAAFIGPNLHIGGSRYNRGKEDNGFIGLGYNFQYKASIGYNINKLSLRLYNIGNFLSYNPSKVAFLSNNVVNIKLGSIYRF